jgi:hypothetical protein
LEGQERSCLHRKPVGSQPTGRGPDLPAQFVAGPAESLRLIEPTVLLGVGQSGDLGVMLKAQG